MARENWKNEKIFERLVNNKSQKTYWNNISELRKRATEEIYDQAYKLAKSENAKKKIIGIDVLAQLGFDPRIGQKKTVKLYFELLENKQNETSKNSNHHLCGSSQPNGVLRSKHKTCCQV